MQEPLMTWNLFLTLFLVPFCVWGLGYWISLNDRKKAKEQDEKDRKLAEAIRAVEIQKEKELQAWRSNFQETLCGVKKSVDIIKDSVNNKVDYEHCGRSHAVIKQDIDHLRDLIGNGVQ